MFVGIDFSINSPGICIIHEEQCHWISKSIGPKTKADGVYVERIKACSDVSYIQFGGDSSSQDSIDSYSDTEYRKIIRYINRANQIKEIIFQTVDNLGYKGPIHFGFEGFSYGSNTNNIIDIAIATGFLKERLIDHCVANQIEMTLDVMAPGTIKKHAGSGRYNKKEMYEVFAENRHSDSKLKQSDFWTLSQSIKGMKKLPKPTDDLIDSYFVANALMGKYVSLAT
jgi:hypothetical protein